MSFKFDLLYGSVKNMENLWSIFERILKIQENFKTNDDEANKLFF